MTGIVRGREVCIDLGSEDVFDKECIRAVALLVSNFLKIVVVEKHLIDTVMKIDASGYDIYIVIGYGVRECRYVKSIDYGVQNYNIYICESLPETVPTLP